MSSLNVKRLVVVVLSQLIGALITFLIITVGFDSLYLFTSIQTPQGVTIQEYGYIYFAVTSIPIGIIIMIWMDRFLETKILPE